MKQFRQGDVLFIKVDSIPENAVEIPASMERGRPEIITARGEVTGHAHVFNPAEVAMFGSEGYEWIDVKKEGAELRHEEHESISFPTGTFQIVNPWQHTPTELVRDID